MLEISYPQLRLELAQALNRLLRFQSMPGEGFACGENTDGGQVIRILLQRSSSPRCCLVIPPHEEVWPRHCRKHAEDKCIERTQADRMGDAGNRLLGVA